MKAALSVLGVLALLSGCATGGGSAPWLAGHSGSRPAACPALPQDQELALNLAQEMVDGGRLHAALANLERLPDSLPEVRLRKARILRSLGQPQAGALYTSLLSTCLIAEGHHGLGQLASAGKRYPEALEHLRQAVALAPTNDAMRNDLGVVFLNLGQIEDARFQLLTALELNQTEKRPALNLLALLIYQNQWDQAAALVTRMGLTPVQFRSAEARAQALKRGAAEASQTAPLPGAAEKIPPPMPVAQPVVTVAPVAAAATPNAKRQADERQD